MVIIHKVLHDLGAVIRRISSHEVSCRNAYFVEFLSHILGVLDAHTETEGLHTERIVYLLSELADDDTQATFSLPFGIQVFESFIVVPAASHRDVAKVRSVINAKVLEGYEKIIFQRIPQADGGGNIATKVRLRDVDPVFSLRSRRQANKLARLKIIEYSIPGICLNMMTFVHNDDVKIVWCIVFERGTR